MDTNCEPPLNKLNIKIEQHSLIDIAVEAIKGEHSLKKLKSIASAIPEDEVFQVFSSFDKNGETALNAAIYKRDVACVNFLLENCHVDPMEKDLNSGDFLLNTAIVNNDYEIVRSLIDSGAELNDFEDSNYYFSPLAFACRRGDVKIARLLIETGADIDKSKCLISAIENFTDNEFIKYILECGADANVEVEFEESPLHACCRSGNLEIIKILVEKGAKQLVTRDGFIPIHRAALNMHEDVIFFFLDGNHCTHREVVECLELSGVGAVTRGDLPLAIGFWNRSLNEINRLEEYSFESTFFKNYDGNCERIQNYDHLIDDIEKAAIHAIMILERIFGFYELLLHANSYVSDLQRLITITQIDFWEVFMNLTLKHSKNENLTNFNYMLTYAFDAYFLSLRFQNLDSSILNLFFKFLKGCFRKEMLGECPTIFDGHIYRCGILLFLSLCYIKANALLDFDIKWLHKILRRFMNSMMRLQNFFFTEVISHIISERSTLPFSDRLLLDTFDICCKISNTLNKLNDLNYTTLHLSLYLPGSDAFIDILLKNGAMTDIRSLTDESIRELLIKTGKPQICIGPLSLQISINEKLDLYQNFEDKPSILKYFMILH